MNSATDNLRIRVLIVDDSAFMRTALSRLVASDRNLRVVGTAVSGSEALAKISALDPEVITLDVQMPGLSGLETLRAIMAQFPRPVIMVSSTTLEGAEITFNALEAGAFDYVPKQLSSTSLDIIHIREALISKIKAGADSWRINHALNRQRKPPRAEVAPAIRRVLEPPEIIAVGISTGGPKALREILPRLPADMPMPILMVQHMPEGFTAPFAKRLNDVCALRVCEAAHGECVLPGVLYIAPAQVHMTVERPTPSRSVICLSSKPANQMYTPSVDVMMLSVAAAYGSHAMGLIMTGMGSDGAEGMKAIHQAGGFTIGQDEASSAVYGMPRVCAEMGILDRLVPLTLIPREILSVVHYLKTIAG